MTLSNKKIIIAVIIVVIIITKVDLHLWKRYNYK